ncbi:hypothetical protein FZ025_16145 [Xanthomonas hyacinthi]|uniref:Alginate lyase domain-containing protein n=1 Tax=Xanthomonas hyacinthi TaxID=56455 RepID=A0A2S7ERH3_9XANT|nr:alginate lyase family protein [Xanthomonas hyacinthi]PPU95676.1 hypothetical protein XhyaCFBP1156_18010 [Xanthomonas hyacinthi]QGY78087.1 hypothetical protein FZ025_16145 [Xanthomonas hyacinthi]
MARDRSLSFFDGLSPTARSASRCLAPLTAALLLCGSGEACADVAATFAHPGIMHTASDIARIKAHLSQEPWASGYAKLKSDNLSSPLYQIQGGHCPKVVRDVPSKTLCINQFTNDGNAAYQQALMWTLSGDPRYAANAKGILNAWSGTLTSIEGQDAQLAAGLVGFKFVAAAELIRYGDAGWSQDDVKASERMFVDVFYPVIKGFAPRANGNWDSSCMKTMMAIGAYTNDWQMFNRALDYYYNGPSNGALLHYVINAEGETQESGRDQAHTQLGIGNLAEMAEVAWAQGFDLYAAYGNRLLAGFEYVANYNLGNEVHFVPMVDTTGKYPHDTISSIGRGEFRPIYEMVLNHYVHRGALSAPFTQQVAVKMRPEGRTPYADNNGFGTLLFTRDDTRKITPRGVDEAPEGFAACATQGGVCNVSQGTGLVAYGANGSWYYRNVGVGQSVACSNASFAGAEAGAAMTCSIQR